MQNLLICIKLMDFSVSLEKRGKVKKGGSFCEIIIINFWESTFIEQNNNNEWLFFYTLVVKQFTKYQFLRSSYSTRKIEVLTFL